MKRCKESHQYVSSDLILTNPKMGVGLFYTLGEGSVGMIQLNVDMLERLRVRCQLDYVTVFHLEYGKTLRLTKDF